MNNRSKEKVDYAAVVLWAFLLIVHLCLWDGFCIAKLWKWFVVPLGVKPISILQAAGITLLLNKFLTRTTHKDLVQDNLGILPRDVMIRNIRSGISRPAVFLFIGWIIHSWQG